MFAQWAIRLRALVRRDEVEAEFDEELRYHFDREVDRLTAQGMSSAEARRAARRSFGDFRAVQEEARETWRWRHVDDVLQDARYARRTILRSPSFAVAVASLAIGLGATTAVYSNADWLLNRPPSGVYEYKQLVMIAQRYVEQPELGVFGLNREQFDALREVQDGFTGVTAFSKVAGVVANDEVSDQVVLQFVEGSYFEVLGIRSAIGRAIGPQDDVPGTPIVGMLAYPYWSSVFGQDPGIVGQTVRINGQSVTIIGVVSREFEGFALDQSGGPSSVFLAMASGEGLGLATAVRGSALFAVGRMRPNTTFAALEERSGFWLDQIGVREFAFGETSLALARTSDARISEPNRRAVERFFGGLLVVCALVLFGACFNVANVFLGRALTQGREYALRTAVGATRGRLIRQMMVEATLVGGVAGVLALAFGTGMALLLAPLPDNYFDAFQVVTPITTASAFDLPSVIATLSLAFASIAAFGLIPVALASVRMPAAMLRNTHAQWSWRGIRTTPRQLVLVLQIALSVGIGIVAGLFGRSLLEAVAVELDHPDPASVLVVRIRPPQQLTNEERVEFHREVALRVEAIPGVVSYALGGLPPYLAGIAFYRPADEETRQVEGFSTSAGPRYFETHGVRMVSGREFLDGPEDADGLIINQTLAKALWPNDDPVGRLVLYGPGEGSLLRVIGVAADEHCNDILDPHACGWVRFGGTAGAIARIRTNDDATALIPAVREVVRELSVDAAAGTPMTLDGYVQRLTGAHRTSAAASSGLAVLAIILVGLGCVSLFLALVRNSAKEIAIRMAIGANGRRVAGRVLLQGFVLTALGIAVGVALAWWASERLVDQLYHIDAHDPLTFVAVPVLVAVIGLCSVGYAAWVATRTDPIKYLKAG